MNEKLVGFLKSSYVGGASAHNVGKVATAFVDAVAADPSLLVDAEKMAKELERIPPQRCFLSRKQAEALRSLIEIAKAS